MARAAFSAFLLATVASSAAPSAIAQPQAAAAQGLGGNPVPGVCLLSREAIFANAAVGKAASARLKQISDAAQAEINTDKQPIDAEARALQSEAARLTPEQRRTREQALAARLQPVQAKAQLRSREIEATREKALERISTEAQPVIAQVYRQRNCGLLVDRRSVLGGNMTNDLTAAVVQGLDARITTISFNRETLPTQPMAVAAPAR